MVPPTPIADALRAAVAASPKSPLQISDEAGLAHTVLSRWLAGRRDITLASLEALGRVLGLRLVEAVAVVPRKSRRKI